MRKKEIARARAAESAPCDVFQDESPSVSSCFFPLWRRHSLYPHFSPPRSWPKTGSNGRAVGSMAKPAFGFSSFLLVFLSFSSFFFHRGTCRSVGLGQLLSLFTLPAASNGALLRSDELCPPPNATTIGLRCLAPARSLQRARLFSLSLATAIVVAGETAIVQPSRQ